MDSFTLEQLIAHAQKLKPDEQVLLIQSIKNALGPSDRKKKSIYSTFQRLGLVGCVDGEPDLSSSSVHLKGFGQS